MMGTWWFIWALKDDDLWLILIPGFSIHACLPSKYSYGGVVMHAAKQLAHTARKWRSCSRAWELMLRLLKSTKRVRPSTVNPSALVEVNTNWKISICLRILLRFWMFLDEPTRAMKGDEFDDISTLVMHFSHSQFTHELSKSRGWSWAAESSRRNHQTTHCAQCLHRRWTCRGVWRWAHNFQFFPISRMHLHRLKNYIYFLNGI